MFTIVSEIQDVVMQTGLNQFAFFFLTTLLILAFVGLILKSPRFLESIADNASPLLTSTGIFFTFLGIFLGLSEFNINEIEKSILPLLDGMKLAFFSSVLGIGYAVFFRIIRLLFVGVGKAKGVEETTAADIHQSLKNVQNAIEKGFANMENVLGGDQDSSVVGQLTRLRTSTADKLDELIKEFRIFAKQVAENGTEALINALEEVMRDFNAKINEQFGDNFKQLNQAVGNLLEWQKNNKAQMDALVNAFEKAKESLEKSEESIVAIAKETQKIPEQMESLSNAHEKLEKELELIYKSLASFADMKDKAINALPIIQKNLENITSKMSESVDQTTSELKTIMEKQQQGFSEITSGFDSMKEKSGEIITATNQLVVDVAKGMEDSLGVFQAQSLKMLDKQDAAHIEVTKQMQERMEVAIRESTQALNGSVTQLDEKMQEEVQRCIQIMGNNLTSITSEFVTQYQKLMSLTTNFTEDTRKTMQRDEG